MALFLFAACSNDKFDGDAGDGSPQDADGAIPINEGGTPDVVTDAGRTMHRLFAVSSDKGVLLGWDDADLIAADRQPEILNTKLTKPTALTVAGDRLVAFDDSSGKLAVWDKAGTVTSSDAPSSMPTFVGPPPAHVWQLVYKPSADLLITADRTTSAVQIFPKAGNATARFGSTNEPFGSAIIDGTDRLFAGETLQGVIKFATGASTKTGVNPLVMDFGGQMFVNAMAIDSTRLYAGGLLASGQAMIAIYDLAKVMPGALPDATLTMDLPIGTVFDVQLVNDVLVVVAGGAPSAVFVYANAKNLTSMSTPTKLTADPISAFRACISAKTGLLYTGGTYKGNAGVQVWKNITATPALQAELRTGFGTNVDGVAIYEP